MSTIGIGIGIQFMKLIDDIAGVIWNAVNVNWHQADDLWDN